MSLGNRTNLAQLGWTFTAYNKGPQEVAAWQSSSLGWECILPGLYAGLGGTLAPYASGDDAVCNLEGLP